MADLSPACVRVRAHRTRGEEVIVDADVKIPATPGHITVLFGPSGSGKTTVLRTLAGLERSRDSRVTWVDAEGREEVWDAGGRRALAPRRRRVGLLFQDHSLFPTMSVAANVAYGLGRIPRADRAERVAEALAAADAAHLADRRWVRELSGGEAQRVALARALAPRPRLLLLDEPLSALDSPTRLRLRTELRRILSAQRIPTVVVTHDRAEALALGDDARVLIDGRVRQAGPVAEVFDRPADADVARVVGVETALPGLVVEWQDGIARVRCGAHVITAAPVEPLDPGSEVVVCIRSEDVSLELGTPQAGTSPRNHVPVVVTAVHPEGALVRVSLDAGWPLTSSITRPAAAELGIRPGQEVVAVVKSTAVHLIAR